MAERVGFEPTLRHNRKPDFESGAFDHSATSPERARMIRARGGGDNLRSDPSPSPAAMHADRVPDLPDGLHRIALGDGRRAIAKVRLRALAGFFEAEARGLAALAASRTLRVPVVHAVDACGILLEDLGSGRPSRAQIEHAG